MSIEEKIKTAKEDSWLKDSVSEKEFKEIKDNERRTTYGEIFEEFCKKFPNTECEDYRPADPMFMPQLKLPIPYAIIIWLKDGSSIVYMTDKERQ